MTFDDSKSTVVFFYQEEPYCLLMLRVHKKIECILVYKNTGKQNVSCYLYNPFIQLL